MPAGIFISYRRRDAIKDARAMYERLSREFGFDTVFMDIEGLQYGDDFVDALAHHLERCQVVLALIGSGWLEAADRHGNRRLDDPKDFVRIELATALARDGVRVIPVLLDNAELPQEAELPHDLRPLVRRQALSLRDASFDADMRHLSTSLRRVLDGVSPRDPIAAEPPGPPASAQSETTPAMASAQLGALRTTAESREGTLEPAQDGLRATESNLLRDAAPLKEEPSVAAAATRSPSSSREKSDRSDPIDGPSSIARPVAAGHDTGVPWRMLALLALLLSVGVLTAVWWAPWGSSEVALDPASPPHSVKPASVEGQADPASEIASSTAPSTLSPTAPVTAVTPTLDRSVSCAISTEFDGRERAKVEQTLLRIGANRSDWTLVTQPYPFMLYLGRFMDKGALAAKLAELRSMGVPAREVTEIESKLLPGISLGEYMTKAESQHALSELAKSGVRSARVIMPTQPSTRERFRLGGLSAGMAMRANANPSIWRPAIVWTECQ